MLCTLNVSMELMVTISTVTQQRDKNKRFIKWKIRNKIIWSEYNMFLYLENSKDFIKTLLLINRFPNLRGYKINIQNEYCYLRLMRNNLNRKCRKNSFYKIITRKIIPGNKMDQRSKNISTLASSWRNLIKMDTHTQNRNTSCHKLDVLILLNFHSYYPAQSLNSMLSL